MKETIDAVEYTVLFAIQDRIRKLEHLTECQNIALERLTDELTKAKSKVQELEKQSEWLQTVESSHYSELEARMTTLELDVTDLENINEAIKDAFSLES